jgi:hypothetical protein
MRDYRKVRDYNDYLMNRDLLLNFPFSKELFIHELAYVIMNEWATLDDKGIVGKKVRKIIWIDDDEERTFGTLGGCSKMVMNSIIGDLAKSNGTYGETVNLDYESVNSQFSLFFYKRVEFNVAENREIKKLGICICYPDIMKLERQDIRFKSKIGW